LNFHLKFIVLAYIDNRTWQIINTVHIEQNYSL